MLRYAENDKRMHNISDSIIDTEEAGNLISIFLSCENEWMVYSLGNILFNLCMNQKVLFDLFLREIEIMYLI